MSEQEAAATPAAPYEEPKKKSPVVKIVFYVVVAAVIGLGAIFGPKLLGSVTTAKVGDCITNSVKADASDAKVVDCTKPEAANKVVGIVDNVSEADTKTKEQELCAKFPTWQQFIWVGKKGGNGQVWCLEPTKK